MTNTRDLLDLATEYHTALPGRMRQYLYRRGIPDLLIDFHLLGWNGSRITIPIFNRQGQLAFFKLARDPEDRLPGPKMMTTPGAYAELYGWGEVLKKPPQIIICEGEFDRLVMEAKGFTAVTSTGGAGVFRSEWASELTSIPEVYVCFDNDEAGRAGAARVGRLIPHARIIELPEDVGKSGDVTDFFVRLSKTRAEFETLMERALPALPEPPSPTRVSDASILRTTDNTQRHRIECIKRERPIADVVGRYVKLSKFGNRFTALCPFHEDRTPSFTVFPATGTFHCFGCSKHGDVITFVREIEGLGFGQALDRLSQPA